MNKINRQIELTEIAEELEQIEEKGYVNENTKFTLIAGENRVKVKNDFVILFYSSFLQIIKDCELTKLDIKLTMQLLEMAQFGNLVSISQSGLAKELGTYQSNVSKSLKSLIASGILIKDSNGHTYFNPDIMTKGKLNEMKKSPIYRQSLAMKKEKLKKSGMSEDKIDKAAQESMNF
jgi:biotin operon repressor